MSRKIVWLLRGFLGLLNFKKWGIFQETYQRTKFDAAFTPSWSQAGEDVAIWEILQNSSTSLFYLDIGAHDPNRFSVTRKLYDSGWRGIDIDGNPHYSEKFEKFRPDNQFLNVCVGSKEEYEFTIFSEGAISTTNSEWVQKFSKEGNKVSEVIRIPGLSLREILDLSNVPQKVGFVNIDIEGADEDALRSISFESLPLERYPSWLLLETAPPVSETLNFPAVKYAIQNGYEPWLVLPMATLLKAPEKK